MSNELSWISQEQLILQSTGMWHKQNVAMFCTHDILVDVFNKMLERNHLNLCTTQYLYIDIRHYLQSRKEWIMCWSYPPTLQSIFLCLCVLPSVSDWTAYQILVTFRIGVLYRKLLCKLQFHENLHSDSHTLLKGINEFLPIISFMTELPEIWCRRSLWNAVELLRAFLNGAVQAVGYA